MGGPRQRSHHALRRRTQDQTRAVKEKRIATKRHKRHIKPIYSFVPLVPFVADFHFKGGSMAGATMDKVVSLCKRRGFLFQGSELYGGLQGTWDYGPMGVELKNNVKRAWWRANVYERDDMEGLDASILMNRLVLRYSGHEATFSDPLVDCRKCKKRFRADQIDPTEKCPEGGAHNLTEPRPFNLMFKTTVGPIEDEDNIAYLRPETAQGIFVNFKNVLDSTNRKLPFGIAQIGKAYRNEITPKNFIFRVREFEQMEIEFFVMPGTDDEWHARWIDDRVAWYHQYGIRPENLKQYVQKPEELAHYAKATTDLLYRFFPEREDETKQFDEVEGIANRTDYDLTCHTKGGKTVFKDGSFLQNEHAVLKQTYFDQPTNSHLTPYVIEPSGGVDRITLAFLMDSYEEQKLEGGKARTVEHLSLEDRQVTVRHRDTMLQDRISVDSLERYLEERLKN